MSQARTTEILEKVLVGNSLSVGASGVVSAHIFHNAVTQTGNGTLLTIGNYKSLTLGISGTSTSRTVEFHVVDENGIDDVIQGIKPKDFSLASSTSGNSETWQFDITGYVTFYAKITAISGGNVTIKGRVVT